MCVQELSGWRAHDNNTDAGNGDVPSAFRGAPMR